MFLLRPNVELPLSWIKRGERLFLTCIVPCMHGCPHPMRPRISAPGMPDVMPTAETVATTRARWLGLLATSYSTQVQLPPVWLYVTVTAGVDIKPSINFIKASGSQLPAQPLRHLIASLLHTHGCMAARKPCRCQRGLKRAEMHSPNATTLW